MIDQIRREVQRSLANVRSALRGVLTGLTLNVRVQRADAEALAGEAVQDMELMQQFGFTSAPPDGAQLILIPLGGRTSAAVVVATEHGAYRLQLNAQGEAALYNQWGDYVWLREGGEVEVVASTKVTITAPLVTMSGDLQVAGKVDAAGHITSGANITAAGQVADGGGTKTMSGMRNIFNAHNHADPQGGTVGTPSGSM